MKRLLLCLLLPGCILAFSAVDPQQPCLEAGYAIAYAIDSCTGDEETANAAFEQFDAEYTCIDRAPTDPDIAAAGIAPEA